MRIPVATYRIQFSPWFRFEDAQAILVYLADLGISHIYASPIFGAREGSTHGYDIISPDQINKQLGTRGEFNNLLATARERGLGWVQDIVPNHMAFDTQNAMLMDILEHGESSPYYRHFDIDWDHPYESMKGKVLAPFLGRFYAECLEAGEIQIGYDEKGLFVRYYDLRLPFWIESYVHVLSRILRKLEERFGQTHHSHARLAEIISGFRALPPQNERKERRNQIDYLKKSLWALSRDIEEVSSAMGETIREINGEQDNPVSFDVLDELLTEQLFRLSFWKVATEEINYRRFFNINRLVCVRVEDEQVFRATHAFILKLLWQDLIDGLRVDHVDGLYDPAGYLARLRAGAPEAYIVVEKILEADEDIPQNWPVQGTTGYDFLNHVNGILCGRDNDSRLERIYARFVGRVTPYEHLVADKKRLFLGRHMAGDVDRLAHLLKSISSKDRYARDITLYGLRRALVEILSLFPVYRTYISASDIDDRDRGFVEDALRRAAESNSALVLELRFIEKFLKLEFRHGLSQEEKQEWVHFVMSFQQFTGPIMAKGLEDTVLYIYSKLLSLNEVGGNAKKVGVSPVEFHYFNKRRAANWPLSMNATSTHDTKRGEDVRARISVISEVPTEWGKRVNTWRRMNLRHKRKSGRVEAPDTNDEYFFYQTLIGTFPFDGIPSQEYRDRIRAYIVKAVREAKVHTAWLKPDEEYESGFLEFIDGVLDPAEDNPFLRDFVPFQNTIAHYGIFNSLTQTTLKLTCPGIPDFYQGTELWDLSLVDPDNRRRVDYELRRNMLQEIRQKTQDRPTLIRELLLHRDDGRIKLFLIQNLLALRQRATEVFERGEYVPLTVGGAQRNNVVAFARRLGPQYVIVVTPRNLVGVVRDDQIPTGSSVWRSADLRVPPDLRAAWRNVLTGALEEVGETLSVARAFESFPVAVFENRVL
jgi:(1->4)-alpha-D-glucan 1-alpha-D-glucosylmutase